MRYARGQYPASLKGVHMPHLSQKEIEEQYAQLARQMESLRKDIDKLRGSVKEPQCSVVHHPTAMHPETAPATSTEGKCGSP
jgi:hypothetical protein